MQLHGIAGAQVRTGPDHGMPRGHCGDGDHDISRLLPAELVQALLQLDGPREGHAFAQMVTGAIACIIEMGPFIQTALC